MIDKNDLLSAEILKLDTLLNDVLDLDDYNYLIDHPTHIINAEYLDAYDYEKITVEPVIINIYDVIKYIITVESYNLDNDELALSDNFYCKELEISESKLNQVEARTIKNKAKYLDAKPIILTAWSDKMITVENSILNRECFLNEAHHHYYYSKTVTLETRDFNDIGPFLKLRDFFNNIKMGDN